MKAKSSSLFILCVAVFILQMTNGLVPGSNDVIPRSAKITGVNIRSSIQSNYAKVVMRNEMVNDGKTSRDTTYSVNLPVSAFISNFTMRLGNRILIGIVKEKEEAKKDFQDAIDQGQTAGHVVQEPQIPGRDMEIFSVNVNVAANSSTVFELTYEELVEKKLDVFVQRIHIEPRQIVPNITLTVSVFDKYLTAFEYKYPGQIEPSSSSSQAVQLSASIDKRMVVYTPSMTQQSEFSSDGIKGDFIVRYELDRGDEGGTIYHDGRNFVHYFSPQKLEVIDKNIIFVIDISGSMGSPKEKIEGTRKAMLYILDKLRPNDYFNILLFDDRVNEWSEKPMLASESVVNQAKTYVINKVHARGSTNIYRALVTALSSIEKAALNAYRGSTIVFLTDGNPTFGEVQNTDQIRRIIKEKNSGRVSIFSLGFGDDVDFDFLETLSLQNNGRARKIHVADDADKQLEGFYQEIESPLLTHVTLSYNTDVVLASSLTQTSYLQYFQGSEIVTVGQVTNGNSLEWNAHVTGKSKSKTVTLQLNNLIRLDNTEFLQRLFAYWKIKDLLNKEKITENEEEKTKLKREILDMSLSYNFVTPLTSMVVTESVHRKDPQRSSLEMDAGVVKRGRNSNVLMSAAFSPNNARCFKLNKHILSLLIFLSLILKF